MSLVDVSKLPEYKCHKRVRAAKITRVTPIADFEVVELGINGGATIVVDPQWAERHKPQPGGYFVRYEDGYESFSPAQAFESGYRALPTKGMDE